MRTEEVMAFSTFEARAHRNRLLIPLAAGAALAVVVVVVAFVLFAGGDDAVTPVQPVAADPPVAVAPPAVTPPPPPPAPKPTEVTTVKVFVTSSPADATVMLGDERLGRTPLTVDRPRQPGKVWLKVRKKGHKTRRIEVDLGADVMWDIALPQSE
jgi:hypothetical protein